MSVFTIKPGSPVQICHDQGNCSLCYRKITNGQWVRYLWHPNDFSLPVHSGCAVKEEATPE